MSDLPLGWATSPIGDLIELTPKNETGDDTIVGFVPMPLMGTGFLEPIRYETKRWSEVKKGYTHFADGDVLLAKITPCFENGKAGIACNLPNGIGAGSTEYFVCRPKSGALVAKYLLAFFKTRDFMRGGEVNMTGSVGHKRVPKDYLLGSEIPLAPLSEQKRIADKLDSLLARVDATRARLDRIPELLKRFRQSVLAAATSGQLTEDWRQEQQAKASAQSIAPVHHGSDSDLPPPKGRVGTITWEWVETDIQSVAAVGTGSTPLRSNIAYFSKTGTPWITSSATSQRLVKVSEEYVTDEAIRAHRLKVYPKGTLLIAMYGEGKTRGQVTELGIPATINQACAAIIVDENKAIKSYVKLALQANYLEMRDMAEGGNQPNLNLSKIKGFPLSLPSINEQIEIVRRVEMIFGFVEELQEKYASAHFKIERLVPALLAKAFRGELVPQDPNDEPAEQLLARIQESRDVAPPTSKRGRKKI